MGFSFEEDVSDLFIRDGIAVGIHKVNREVVRRMAKKSFDYVKSVEASGRNKNTADIDVSDATVDIFTRIKLSEFGDYLENFSQAFADEKIALALHDFEKSSEVHNDNIAKIESDAKTSAFNQAALSWVIAIAAVLIFGMFLFSR